MVVDWVQNICFPCQRSDKERGSSFDQCSEDMKSATCAEQSKQFSGFFYGTEMDLNFVTNMKYYFCNIVKLSRLEF